MENKLNFVSFTPGTSFEMGHSGGRRPRAGSCCFIFWLRMSSGPLRP